MKKRSIMLVAPNGSIKSIRLSPWVMVALIIMAAVGSVGYFIPLNRFILTEQEFAQKNILEEQNALLHNNIGTTLKMLSDLKERVTRIEAKKEQSNDIIGLPRHNNYFAKSQKNPTSSLSSAAVLRYLTESEKLIAKFTASIGEGKSNMFDTIPVSSPVPADISIISRLYGMERDPFTGKNKIHNGVDFAAEVGAPVTATAAGVVTKVENDPSWGRRVTVTHGRGFRTVYAHLGAIRVAPGKAVKRGEEIGTIGVSGLSTGPHVHYEVWVNDKQVNPEEYFFPTMAVANRNVNLPHAH